VEGPYRDLGAGFARLAGAEGARRSPRHLRSVEDALHELLRNSRDAGANNIYVASSLKERRYRHLVVIDDGFGIPDAYKHLVFEPGVTTRHVDPIHDGVSPHGAGLSLYHVKNVALAAEILFTSSPTAIKTVFDTYAFPEKSLQSDTRPSNTNLLAILSNFAFHNLSHRLYHGSPSRIAARLLEDHIIQTKRGELAKNEGTETDIGSKKSSKGSSASTKDIERVLAGVKRLGLELSSRTVRRVISGEVSAAGRVVSGGGEGRASRGDVRRNGAGGPILSVGAEDLAEIRAVLRRAARSSYLDLAEIELERHPGEVVLRALVYEPEEAYE